MELGVRVAWTSYQTDAQILPSSGKALLTLRETGWVVVNVGDHNGDGGGAREAAQLACHVCGLDHHLIALLALAVEVRHRSPDHACGRGRVRSRMPTSAAS